MASFAAAPGVCLSGGREMVGEKSPAETQSRVAAEFVS